VQRISKLLDQAISDDIFTVAADALLNLEADESHLKMAVALTFQRLAQSPDKVFLYRLATDLLTELSCPIDPRDLLIMASAHAPNRRIAFLREAQRMPAGNHREWQLDLGTLLLTMDCKLPPQAYIALGKQFLEQGHENIAQYLFRRNNLLSDNPTLSLEIADHYDRYAEFEKASRMVRECLFRAPDDMGLLTRSASYYEIMGEMSRAFKQFRKLHTLSLGALSLSKEKAIVSRLQAIEEMAGVDILCSDKTGTLYIENNRFEDVGRGIYDDYATITAAGGSVYVRNNTIVNAKRLSAATRNDLHWEAGLEESWVFLFK
jgi:tetratricopeptide (TPR) repeat protein